MKTYLAFVLLVIVAFVSGRFTANKNTEQIVQHEAEKEETKSHTVTEVVQAPGGETKTVTTVDTVTRVNKDRKTKETIKEVVARKRQTNISALIGYDSHRPGDAVYGVSITRELVGPITYGVWGLTSGVAGVSAGINF